MLARLFFRKTGMTYSQWNTLMVVLEGIERLTRGNWITDVALDLGYTTTSSFVYMFRQNVGLAPVKWLTHQAHTAGDPLRDQPDPRSAMTN